MFPTDLTQAPGAAQTDLDTGRAALARHEWRSAFDGLSASDAQMSLNPEGLELLAESAHDRAVREAMSQQGGEVVKATGDGFFVAFADADHAIEAAVTIQRRLAEHRRSAGFAPAMRIGIHQAVVNRVGLDYTGSGVNQASRVGAAADGDEILVSATTFAVARHVFAEGGRRTVELKGLAKPVEVVSVAWR